MATNWTRDELVLAMNLYCRLPFGKFHRANPDVIELAELIQRTPSAVAMKLSNLASLDPYHSQRGVKGLSSASKADREIWSEFHADWESLGAESELLLENKKSSLPNREEADIKPFEGETETTRTVKVRMAQGFFRKSVLASYDMTCCVTELAVPTLLVASHILPWSSHPQERVNPHNGLCLNSLFDRAFDRGLITFDEEFRLVLSRLLHEAETQSAIKQHFLPYSGERMRMPSKFIPVNDFLTQHREEVFEE